MTIPDGTQLNLVPPRHPEEQPVDEEWFALIEECSSFGKSALYESDFYNSPVFLALQAKLGVQKDSEYEKLLQEIPTSLLRRLHEELSEENFRKMAELEKRSQNK